MKNIIRVTAIILTMVTVIVTHPFLSLEAKVFERPIKNDRIFNTTYPDNTYAQISYEYKVDNPLQGDIDFAQFNIYGTYEMILYINFKQDFDVINFTFTLTNPYVTTYNLNYAVINGYALSSNTQYSTITIEAKNTDMVEVHIVWDNDMVAKMYHYYWIDNMLEGALTSADVIATDWVEHGYDWCDILSFRVNSYILASDPLATLETTTGNIYTSINGIQTSVDNIDDAVGDIKSYLLNIEDTVYEIYELLNGMDIGEDTYLYEFISGTANTTEHALKISVGDFYQATNPGNPISPYPDTIYKAIPSNNNNNYWETTFTRTKYGYGNGYAILSLGSYYTNRLYYLEIPNFVTYNQHWYYYLYFDNPSELRIDRLQVEMWCENTGTCHLQVRLDYYNNSDGVVYSNFQPIKNYVVGVYVTTYPITADDILKTGFKDLITAINNINVSVNVSNTQITTEINEYNTTINNAYTIENNISTTLNNQMQQFTPDNTSVMQRLNDSSILLKSVITQINGIDLFTIPIAVALVGIVLMAILG